MLAGTTHQCQTLQLANITPIMVSVPWGIVTVLELRTQERAPTPQGTLPMNRTLCKLAEILSNLLIFSLLVYRMLLFDSPNPVSLNMKL